MRVENLDGGEKRRRRIASEQLVVAFKKVEASRTGSSTPPSRYSRTYAAKPKRSVWCALCTVARRVPRGGCYTAVERIVLQCPFRMVLIAHAGRLNTTYGRAADLQLRE